MRRPLKILRLLFNRETLWALVIVLILVAVWIMTSDSAPTWIYQGF
jgi:hypothetical protein